MADYLWDLADGPDPNETDDCDSWTDGEWRSWFDDHPAGVRVAVPRLRAVISINPHPYL